MGERGSRGEGREVSPQTGVDELSGQESKEALLESATAFTHELTNRYPQLDEEGKLNYYLAGSLALTLLVRAGKFDVLDEARLPQIVPLEHLDMPSEARAELMRFVRRIGDLDYIQMPGYVEQKREMNRSYNKKELSDEEYQTKRKEYLWKGGGGLQPNELPEHAARILAATPGTGIMYDPLETATPHRVIQLEISGRNVYTAEPKTMLAYKAVHLGESFDSGEKTDKFVNDFTALVRGLDQIYGRDDLVRAACDTVYRCAPNFPNSTFVPYHHPGFTDEMRKFFDELIAADSDAPYLDGLTFGRERSIGILKVVHRYAAPESKKAIIEFINRNRDQIDLWKIVERSHENRAVIAEYLLSLPELPADIAERIKEEVTKESVTKALSANVWAIYKYGQELPDQGQLQKQPASSGVLDVLMQLREVDLPGELGATETLISRGMKDWDLKQIVASEVAQDPPQRHALLEGLVSASEILSEKDRERFFSAVSRAATNDLDFDYQANSWSSVSPQERARRVGQVFATYGVKWDVPAPEPAS